MVKSCRAIYILIQLVTRAKVTMSELVNYKGDVLSVVRKPPRDCQAVIEARNDMLGIIDMDRFLSDLVTTA